LAAACREVVVEGEGIVLAGDIDRTSQQAAGIGFRDTLVNCQPGEVAGDIQVALEGDILQRGIACKDVEPAIGGDRRVQDLTVEIDLIELCTGAERDRAVLAIQTAADLGGSALVHQVAQ
jgi:hypothetical protein